MARQRGRSPRLSPGTLVIDSGAVTACAKAGIQRQQLLGLLAAGWTPIAPAAVLSEALTGHGGHDARANQLLATLGAEGIACCDETIGRKAAALRRPALQKASPSGVDAIVAAHAAAATPSAVIMTGDPNDLRALTSSHDHIRVLPI